MLRPLSVNEIHTVCNEKGLSISTTLVERIKHVFDAAVAAVDEQSVGTRDPEDPHKAFDSVVQKFAGLPEGTRNLERPEGLTPVQIRRVLDLLDDAKLALADLNFREATLDLLFDYLGEELVPLSQGRPGMKEDANTRALFDVLAKLYVTEIQNGAKLTEASTGMKVIQALLSRAGVNVAIRTLRSWEEKRSKPGK